MRRISHLAGIFAIIIAVTAVDAEAGKKNRGSYGSSGSSGSYGSSGGYVKVKQVKVRYSRGSSGSYGSSGSSGGSYGSSGGNGSSGGSRVVYNNGNGYVQSSRYSNSYVVSQTQSTQIVRSTPVTHVAAKPVIRAESSVVSATTKPATAVSKPATTSQEVASENPKTASAATAAYEGVAKVTPQTVVTTEAKAQATTKPVVTNPIVVKAAEAKPAVVAVTKSTDEIHVAQKPVVAAIEKPAKKKSESRVFHANPTEPAVLVVNVPKDASVYLAGHKMTIVGPTRQYRIPMTTAGRSYSYPVRIEVTRNGEVLTSEHTESVSAGKVVTLSVNEEELSKRAKIASR